MHGLHFIQDLAVVLVVAGAVGWICQRIGLSVIVGFLVAGIVVGPNSPPFALGWEPRHIADFKLWLRERSDLPGDVKAD